MEQIEATAAIEHRYRPLLFALVSFLALSPGRLYKMQVPYYEEDPYMQAWLEGILESLEVLK